MDPKTVKLVEEWKKTLTSQERELHDLAAVMLKKTLNPNDMQKEDKDNGSYYVEKCHAFKSWLKTKN